VGISVLSLFGIFLFLLMTKTIKDMCFGAYTILNKDGTIAQVIKENEDYFKKYNKGTIVFYIIMGLVILFWIMCGIYLMWNIGPIMSFNWKW
jgi:cytochrome b subunit of formate dehydrogenase